MWGVRGLRKMIGVGSTLVVLIAVAVAGYAAWGDGASPVLAKYTVTEPDLNPRRPYPATPPDPLVRPPGKEILSKSRRPNEFINNSSLTRREVVLLVRKGVAKIQTVITRKNGVTLAVWRFTVRDRSDPRAARDALDGLYAQGGYTTLPTHHQGVLVRRIANPLDQPELTSYRSHYVRGSDVLRVEAYGRQQQAVDEAFHALLDEQTDKYPASR